MNREIRNQKGVNGGQVLVPGDTNIKKTSGGEKKKEYFYGSSYLAKVESACIRNFILPIAAGGILLTDCE